MGIQQLVTIVGSVALLGGGMTYGRENSVDNRTECERLKDRHFMGRDEIRIECDGPYHHIYTDPDFLIARNRQALGKPRNTIKIGSFNLYRLGDGETKFKRYDILADIMNQWDVVGVTELMALSNDETQYNDKMDVVIEGTRWDTPDAKALIYYEPGYVRLLKTLQERDPAWALLLTPEEQGASSYKELYGFYYRATAVTPIETAHCGAVACIADYSNTKIFNQFSRVPFVGSFRSGEFDFTLWTTHIRSRPVKDPKTRDEWMVAQYGDRWDGVTSTSEYPRVSEITSILDLMNQTCNGDGVEKDCILLGDMNFDYDEAAPGDNPSRVARSWIRMGERFPGMAVVVNSPSTLGKRDSRHDVESGRSAHGGLSDSRFDHFVFRPGMTSECSRETATTFNFLDPGVMARLSKSAGTSDVIAQLVEHRDAADPNLRSANERIFNLARDARRIAGKATTFRGRFSREVCNGNPLKAIDYLGRLEKESKKLLQSIERANTALRRAGYPSIDVTAFQEKVTALHGYVTGGTVNAMGDDSIDVVETIVAAIVRISDEVDQRSLRVALDYEKAFQGTYVSEYRTYLENQRTVSQGQLVPRFAKTPAEKQRKNDESVDELMRNFLGQVINELDAIYTNAAKNFISDHLPIVMTCATDRVDDD